MRANHSRWVEQRRALRIEGVRRRILGRVCGLRVAVVSGIAFTAVSALADGDILVPRDFPTIQAAVDAAAPAATIKVHRGTYTEQIVIAKDVTLKGSGAGDTIIKAPPVLTPDALNLLNNTPVAAIVRITDGANVRMSGFTVSGPTPCFGVRGVAVVKASTLDLSDSHVTLIRPGDPNCAGTADFRSSGVVIGFPEFILLDGEAEGGTTGHGRVTGVTVDQCLGTGIAVLGPFQGPPSTATISDNVVTGGTPFAAVQGGITVSFASVARVTGNTIRNIACADPACGRDPITEFQSVGIGVNLTPPGTVIEDNAISRADVGIYLFGSEGCCQTRENRLADNRFFGIVIQDGSNEIAENEISGGEVGIGVVADFVDTVAVSRGDRIKRTSVAPIQEIDCCGFTATAIVEDD